jgi:dephospho-CoA kinase
VSRVQNSRKWPLDEIAKREKFQDLIPHKREKSDVIINNNNSKENTLNQVKDFWCQFITKK